MHFSWCLRSDFYAVSGVCVLFLACACCCHAYSNSACKCLQVVRWLPKQSAQRDDFCDILFVLRPIHCPPSVVAAVCRVRYVQMCVPCGWMFLLMPSVLALVLWAPVDAQGAPLPHDKLQCILMCKIIPCPVFPRTLPTPSFAATLHLTT